MQPFKSFFILTLFLLSSQLLYAQKSKGGYSKSSYTLNKHNFKAPRVGHHKAKTICPIFENSKYPYQGIGFKVGDPFSLSYKLYPVKHYAFVLDVGSPSSSLYSKLFREEFTLKTDELTPDLEGVEYLSHEIKSDFVLDAKVLYQLDADKLSKGLQVYGGLGWELRRTSIEYDYFYQTAPNFNEPGTLTTKRLTQGVQAAVGIEYAYFQLPISAFIEMEYYIDMQQQPGWTHLQGGIGLRYVF
ncbi:hypothetical protein SanaruYs_09000 [Chryseotalea sanaruensis]|uniref:Outer membrane protein beta-barrel domain-containing protein n=1 Tax=Chryseotalea sanaruensis TaxID=2482724 RepID=A0A401U731_9BACT|nr:hypothetical protein [Chryseotalea sanaruensis]GCC50682.1 hypothetical protein SanaruYs_09000 [Chryseotalea sanaruensis]